MEDGFPKAVYGFLSLSLRWQRRRNDRANVPQPLKAMPFVHSCVLSSHREHCLSSKK
jgi:hypothetical protein